MLYPINFRTSTRGDGTYLPGYIDATAYSGQRGSDTSLIYASVIIDSHHHKELSYSFNSNSLMLNYRGMNTQLGRKDYDMFTHKNAQGGEHIIFKIKSGRYNSITAYGHAYISCDEDTAENIGNLWMASHNNDPIPEEITKCVYDTIKDYTSIPFIKEWSEYAARKMLLRHDIAIIELSSNCDEISIDYGFTHVIEVCVSDDRIKSIISSGLASKEISIDGNNAVSSELKGITGLTSYLEEYGQILADKIKANFKPKFDPDTMKISDKVEDFFSVANYYTPDIIPYKMQKNVLQAITNHLHSDKHVILSGEPGAGKTIMSIGSVVASASKPNFSVIVMCPKGTVKGWRDEIIRTVPMSEVYIVNDMSDFLKAEKILKNKSRVRSLWVIISDGTAKSDYEVRPAIEWKKVYDKDTKSFATGFVCPKCGKILNIKRSRDRFGNHLRNGNGQNHIDDFDIMSIDDDNSHCKNTIKINDGDVTKEILCDESVWTAATKNNSSDWVKITKVGWVYKKRIPQIKLDCQRYINGISSDAPNSYAARYKTVLAALTDYESNGSIERFPNRYSIARYIRKHLKNVFDFGIFDEVHELATNSLQGRAFGDICCSVKKTIGCTGTLSNGYASGLFYLLFRTNTRNMLERGYTYKDINDFSEKYGVSERICTEYGVFRNEIARNNHDYNGFVAHRRVNKKKNLAGVSPILFTDFLLDNAIFLKQKDIKKDLCDYTEIPMGIDMDQELEQAYTESISGTIVEIRDARNRKELRNAINKLAMFLDQPFGIEILRTSRDIGDENSNYLELSDETIRAKEQALIDLAVKKKAAGEKMLVYCEWTGKLDIANRLARLLNENGVNAVTMSTNIKQEDRQSWLNKQAAEGDLDVVVLNPRLVEVGLNLLDYTTIVFYEIGTKLFTVRQASQRSRRINQTHPVEIYFMYYNNTIQEKMLGVISQKLKASVAIEGDFSDDGLSQFTDDTDILTALANSIAKNEKIVVDKSNFESTNKLTDDKNAENSNDFKENTLHFSRSLLQSFIDVSTSGKNDAYKLLKLA